MNYVVRVNLLDRNKVSLQATEECSFDYQHPVTEKDIMLHAYADELNFPRALLKMLLASPNQMESFNPVKDYLELPLSPVPWATARMTLPWGLSERRLASVRQRSLNS